jgi:predicted PurR-regulated permease PerM
VVWVVISFFFGWIPLLGPVLALIAYTAIINWRYPGGWGTAIVIAVIAWISAFVVLYMLGVMGITTFDAMGVPGV